VIAPAERAILESRHMTPERLKVYYDVLERELIISRENRVRYEQAVRELLFGDAATPALDA
jgi:hypothetical protein